MLVLSRKLDQKIIIGEGIEVQVLEIRGNAVRLGVNAPPEVAVHREEVFMRINRQSPHSPTAEFAQVNPPLSRAEW